MSIKLIATALLSVCLLSACTKKSTTTPTPTPTPTPTKGFTWSENGAADITADSAYFENRYNTIKAYKSGKFIEINLYNGVPATYPLGTTSALALLITSTSSLYNATSGNLIISANASGKISGTFTSKGTGASITTLDGKFTDIEVR